MAKVELRKIVKRYKPGQPPAVGRLGGVDLTIADGEFFILLGPSGCGKSTLLRMVAGLEEISGGELLIDGRRVNDVAPKDRDIAMVFQSYALYPHMTVRDNLAFGLRMRGVAGDEIGRRIEGAAKALGLDPYMARLPKELSGGQRQRVALGRAIVREPKVFLLDEPLSNLDAKLRGHMRVELKRLHQRLRATMIYVTHDQVEAMTLGDRVAVMQDGEVQQVGTPLEVYDQPTNRFVAGFLGSPTMNFVPATLEGTALLLDERPLDLPTRLRGAAPAREPVELGIRPEDLTLAPDEDGPGLVGEVAVVEPLGAETVVTVDTRHGAVVARLEPGASARPGARVRLVPVAERMHLFRPGSGERVGPPPPLRQEHDARPTAPPAEPAA
ncbi:MAG: sn-glycerol-3-phosphate ABC transporter ATP-binding protein UgpC [Planctomycetes bacterium]|nr:sn-glycerol-3-phosphate ABC transporter ATP-binding protein UgpC [Planctomycetota bacterium]